MSPKRASICAPSAAQARWGCDGLLRGAAERRGVDAGLGLERLHSGTPAS
jgi:hypothetical protein